MKKCLFVITGDTFRIGGQRSTGKGGDESFRRQNLATDSHLRFFESIEKKFDIQCDVFLNIYKCNDEYDKQLFEWYGDRVVQSKIHPGRLGSEFEMIYDTIGRLINSKIDDYEFIMFIRPDWYLKKYFDEVFRPDPERVLYAHLDAGYKLVENPTGFIDGGGRRRDIPHVCHCITYCPKKHYRWLLENRVWHWHDSLLRLEQHLPRTQFGFFVDTVHWCCSSLDWNPLYSLVGRDEHLEYKFPNISYDIETHTVHHADTLERYKDVLYTDTIEENLKSYG